MKITKRELCWFSSFVKNKGLEDKFEGCQVYHTTIYFDSWAYNYITWKENSEDEVFIKVVKAINAMFDLDLELVI